jgi:hypothetical protein
MAWPEKKDFVVQSFEHMNLSAENIEFGKEVDGVQSFFYYPDK